MNDHTPDWYQPQRHPTSNTEAVGEPDHLPAVAEPMYTSPRSSRRAFLGLAAAGAATIGGGVILTNDRDREDSASPSEEMSNPPEPTTTTRPLIASEDVAGRTLVVVELAGGNDGLATLVPRNRGVLYDRRESVHIPDEELIDFTDEYGWNPALESIAGHGIGVLLGLGAVDEPDGSHFEMERRWWAGKSAGTDLPGTGFLGRLCDQLAEGQPVTGLSLGGGSTPALRADKAVTIGLNDPEAGWYLREDGDPWFSNLRSGLADMAGGSATGVGRSPLDHARSGLADTLAFAEVLQEIDDEQIENRYPNTHLGWSLGTAAQIMAQESGIRVFHVSLGGFDTHSEQRGTHDELLRQVGDSMGAFLSDIGDRGMAESTLVCTTSEFGRRVASNGRGTDHGEAGIAILAGPVNAGIHGEMPSLSNLNDGNLATTVDFEQYYATLAEKWFGIPSSEVLDTDRPPLEGVIA